MIMILSLLQLLKYYFTNFTNCCEYHFLFKFRDYSISAVIVNISYSKQFFLIQFFFIHNIALFKIPFNLTQMK